MATLGISAASEVLKNFYLPVFQHQYNDKASVFLAQLEKTTEGVYGQQIKLALSYGSHGGIHTNTDDTAAMPTPSSRKYKQVSYTTKNIEAQIELSDKLIKTARSNKAAFADMLEYEMDAISTDTKSNLARQVVGDGTGSLGLITAASHSSGVTTLTLAEADIINIAEGMVLDIYDNSSSAILTNGADLPVTGVDEDNNKITVTDANDISAAIQANADYLVVANSQGSELTGIKAVFENTTLYGVDRSTAAGFFLKPRRVNVDGELTDVVLQKAIDLVERRGGETPNLILCSHGVRRAYQNLLQASKSFTADPMELKGGWKTISYNGIPLTADKHVASGKMYFLNTDYWKLYQMGDFEWLEEGGAILQKKSGYPIYEAGLVRYADLGVTKIKANAECYSITEH